MDFKKYLHILKKWMHLRKLLVRIEQILNKNNFLRGPILTYGDGIKAYASATDKIYIYNSVLVMVEN